VTLHRTSLLEAFGEEQKPERFTSSVSVLDHSQRSYLVPGHKRVGRSNFRMFPPLIASYLFNDLLPASLLPEKLPRPEYTFNK